MVGAAGCCQAQSQPTYKCVTAGKVAYSDEPCVGAIVVDTTPTQGLDKITGTSKKGADVQKIEFNKAMAEALKPVFNETPDQRSQRHKRSKLLELDKLECGRLEGEIQDKRVMDTRELVALYQARKRYKDLKC
ncbi:hypothetical protein BH10PSE16_BH10PSE16_39050 [soil metagenome]